MAFIKRILVSMLSVFLIGNGEDAPGATGDEIGLGWLCWILLFALGLFAMWLAEKRRKKAGR